MVAAAGRRPCRTAGSELDAGHHRGGHGPLGDPVDGHPYPVDITPLADEAPPPCRFLFAETATFGTSIDDFHKISYQSPPDAGLISQAAAVYVDPPTARAVFDELTHAATDCAQTPFGQTYLGELRSDDRSLRTRAGECGRDYRLKAVVLAEVTFCAFGESVSDIVLANLLGGVPE